VGRGVHLVQQPKRPVLGWSRRGELDFGSVPARRRFLDLVPEIVESARYAAADPAKPFCSEGEEGETSRVVCRSSGSGAPRSRPAVLLPSARLEGCPRDFYTRCQESGRIRMRLTFTPARD
jgi:hypothetical protein